MNVGEAEFQTKTADCSNAKEDADKNENKVISKFSSQNVKTLIAHSLCFLFASPIVPPSSFLSPQL